MVDPCKSINNKVNVIITNIDKVVRGLIPAINVIINGINLDLKQIVIIINLGIELFNEFISGFMSKLNDILNNCKDLIRLLVNISSGTLFGWLYLFYSPVVTLFFSMFNIEMDLTTLMKITSIMIYLILIGNMYNIFDLFSSSYKSSYIHYKSNCNNY